MNERILELADKAVEDVSSGPWNISDEFCIKFAELIVRECLVVINQYNGVGDDDVIKISMDVKEHFGVEE